MSGVPPLKNSAFSFEIALDSQSDGDVFQTSVTLAAGDVQVSKDGGAFANITSLPTEISSTGVLIVALTADEMNADRVTVRFHDEAGDEWKDRLVTIFTDTAQINDLALATSIPSAASVSDAVWDELLSGHAIAGSTGAALTDPLLNTVPGSYPSGSAGDALGRIGSGQITTVSPVAQDGDVETIQGDDYDNTHGRALDWTDDSAAWPELISATIAVVIGRALELVGSVVTATGDSKKVRVELTDVQSAAIRVGVHRFQVIATLSDDDVITLVEANWTSRRRLEA